MAYWGDLPHPRLRVHLTLVRRFNCRVFVHARIDTLTHPRFWSLLPSTILDWVVIIVSVSPSVDAPKCADTSRECYLEYFAHAVRTGPTSFQLVPVSTILGCTSLHLRKHIATGVTHHLPAWHTSHIYVHLLRKILNNWESH